MSNVPRAALTLACVVFLSINAQASQGDSASNPVPINTAVDLGDSWVVKVLEVIPNATKIVLQENKFNDPPRSGNQFFLAKIEAKYEGDGDAFLNEFRFIALGPSGQEYSTETNDAGVIPDPLPAEWTDSGETISGYIGWEVGSSDAPSLVMCDKYASPRVYMALYD